MAKDVLEAVLQLTGVGRFTSGFRQIADSVDTAAEAQEKFQLSSATLAAGGAAVSLGIAAGLRKAVEEAGKFEAKVLSFNRLFGQGEGFSRQFLKQMQDFSLQTPYTFGDISEYAVRLKAMGFAAHEILPIFQTLGDANAVLNQGSRETFQRILLAIGQIRTRGKAVMQEINQLTQAQVPAYEILSQKLGILPEQMAELGRQGISAKETLDALFSGMRERYGGAMQIQLNTVQGRIGQIQTAWEQFLIAVGKPIVPGVLGGLTMVADTLKAMAKIPPAGGGAIAGLMLGTSALAGILALSGMGRMAGAGFKLLMGASGGPTTLMAGGIKGMIAPLLGMTAGMALTAQAQQTKDEGTRRLMGAAGGAFQGGAIGSMIGSALVGAGMGARAGPIGIAAGLLLGGAIGYATSGKGPAEEGQTTAQQILDAVKQTATNTGQLVDQNARREAKIVAGGQDVYRPFPEANLQALAAAIQ